MSNTQTVFAPCGPNGLPPDPCSAKALRPARVPADLAALLLEWGDFSDDERGLIIRRAERHIAAGSSSAGAIEDALVELREGVL